MALHTAFLLVAAFASLLASSTLSADGGFRATLKHIDHGKTLAPDELFQRAVHRTKARVEGRHSQTKPSGLGHVSGNDGEFSISLTIGTPAISYLAFIDIDTDLIWTMCKPAVCLKAHATKTHATKAYTIKCANPTRYNPANSTTYAKLPCASKACKLATNTSCNTKEDSCTYKYNILSRSPSTYTEGYLATEKFGGFNGEASAGKFIFGCAHSTSISLGDIDSGFVGLGRGFTSLTSQMNATRFSHCFPSYDHSDATGMIAFGVRVKKLTPKSKRVVITTDLIQNQHKPSSYYVRLTGIKVNRVALALDPTAFHINRRGKGGTVMDSGVTVSYLDEVIYNKLKDKLVSVINLKRASGDKIGLDLCYAVPKGLDPAASFPSISFTFASGNKHGDLFFSWGNVFRSYDDVKYGEITCLAMLPALKTDGRSSIGNIQLQETLVVYDLAAKKVSFVPELDCSKI